MYTSNPAIPNPALNDLPSLRGLRVAVVHEWLTTLAGSEKVVEQILLLFPDADLFALVDHLPPAQRGFLGDRKIRTSFLQKIPFSAKLFRKLLWLLPSAIESFDLSGYDIVISSSHAVAKGVITGPGQLHICYCHSPIRYAWDLQHDYLRQSGLERGLGSLYARLSLHYLRMWDVRTSNGVDHFIANSNFIARRIEKVYRRQATVIHPPVAVDRFRLHEEKDDYYLAASRLVAYKRMDLIVKAFAQMPNRKLIVVGDGPEMSACKTHATPNIQFLGFQCDASLRQFMGRAKGFLFAAEEDFGIIVVEAQGCGTPVICLGRGGVLDSVIPGRTGLFFPEQSAASIAAAVDHFETLPHAFDPVAIRRHAEQFSPEEFRRKFAQLVAAKWHAFRSGVPPSEAAIDPAPRSLAATA